VIISEVRIQIAHRRPPCGHTPKARVTGKLDGVAAMSAISRPGHLLFRLLGKRIACCEVIDFLSQMLKHRSRCHLVVGDGSGQATHLSGHYQLH
jgi:hypothetical protein